MQPDITQQPLSDDSPIVSEEQQKPAKKSRRIKSYNEYGLDLFGNIDPLTKIDEGAKQENLKLLSEQFKRIGDNIEQVVGQLEQEKLGEQVTHDIGDTFKPDSEESKELVRKYTNTIEAIKKSVPNRIHTGVEASTQAFFLNQQREKFTQAFIQKYDKAPEQVIAENVDVPTKPGEVFDETKPLTTELIEARNILNLNNLVNDLSGERDTDYWKSIDWNKQFWEGTNPEFMAGLTKDLYRATMEGIGVNSLGLPVTPEGIQWNKNNKYKLDWRQLPEDSFLKQMASDKDIEQIFNFALMNKLPSERPFLLEGIKAITSSFAALPFYLGGLTRLNLITKTGESGLFEMGAKEFGKQLLKSPFYTQPGRLATDVLNDIDQAENVGDIFSSIGKSYMNGLSEVIGEVSTPILAKGLKRFKTFTSIEDLGEKMLGNLSKKINLNVKTGVDYLLLSPVTETFEEEISNALNLEPSVFTGNFDLKRLGLEAISALGLGVPIGIIKSITSNNMNGDTDNASKLVDLTVQKVQENPELLTRLQEQMDLPTGKDFNLINTLKDYFTKTGEFVKFVNTPDEVNLPMTVQNEPQPNLDKDNPAVTFEINDKPDNSVLDKTNQQENKDKDFFVRMDTNGIIQAIAEKFPLPSDLRTSEQLYDWMQQFKTGNHELDWNKFYVAWNEKFPNLWNEPDFPASNRTKLQEVFVALYNQTKTPTVALQLNGDNVTIKHITTDAYIDADRRVKSTTTHEELWEKLKSILPPEASMFQIKIVDYNGSRYNSLSDVKFADDKVELLQTRNALMKQGYFWTGVIPNSKTGILVDVNKLLQEPVTDENVNTIYSGFANMMYDEILGQLPSDMDKIKRIKAITGNAPDGFVFQDLKDLLAGQTTASSVYLTEDEGKTKINYKYVVLDASTIPNNFNSDIGDGEEYSTPFLSEIVYMLNGVPLSKRGVDKPKLFSVGRFEKNARKTVHENSPLAQFMKRNGIAAVKFSSMIKVGLNEDMINYNDIVGFQQVDASKIYEQNLLEQSHISSKGRIAQKAAGVGPALLTTAITHYMTPSQLNDFRDWLKQDFRDEQEQTEKLHQNPDELTQEAVNYVKEIEYDSDITRFIKTFENADFDYLVREPAVMDFLMKGYFEDRLFKVVRHYKRGFTPVQLLDLGKLSNYSSLDGAMKEAFDDNGYLKKGYGIIDYYSAKKFGYKVGDKFISTKNPPGSLADIRSGIIAGILPKEMDANQFVGSVQEHQDNTGSDGDADWTNYVRVSTDLDNKIWKHLNQIDGDTKLEGLMSKFQDKTKAKLILRELYKDKSPEEQAALITPAEIDKWALIAPLIKLNSNTDGVFPLNPEYGKMDLSNPEHWAQLNAMAKTSLIGQLYSWKRMYTLFLENNYELNGIKANPDVDFNIPMMKVLTDLALDWTKSFDVNKMQFNWTDLVYQLFTLPEIPKVSINKKQASIKELQPLYDASTEEELKSTFRRLISQHHPDKGGNLQIAQAIIGTYYEKLGNVEASKEYKGLNREEALKDLEFRAFNRALRPIREAFKLIGLKDEMGEMFDYAGYYQQLQYASQQLKKLPSGLENSILFLTIDGINSLKLPKFALTIQQATNVQARREAQILGVKEDKLNNVKAAKYTNLQNATFITTEQTVMGKPYNIALTGVLKVFKALSFLGVAAKPEAELVNIKLLQQYTRLAVKGKEHALKNIFFDWLNKIMPNVRFKVGTEGQSAEFGNTGNGYRFKISNINNNPVYKIGSLQNGKYTSVQEFDNWQDFIANVPANFYNVALNEIFVDEVFGKLVQTTTNPIVKQASDELLNISFSDIVNDAKFKAFSDNIREDFYLALMGLLNLPGGKIDLGVIVSDYPNLRISNEANLFNKTKITSYAKPITLMNKYAINDEMAIETMQRWYENSNELIKQEVSKENDIKQPEKILPSLFLPIPLSIMQEKTEPELVPEISKALGFKPNSPEEIEYIGQLLLENHTGDKRSEKVFRRTIKKALKEADKKYGLKWRILLFNPFINSHTIPFDIFVDIFSKKDKLVRGSDVVYRYPLNGKLQEIFGWQIDTKFKHWSMLHEAKNISNAQIWWYIQDSLDRNYESSRLELEDTLASVPQYITTDIPGFKRAHQEEVVANFILLEAWDIAEGKELQDKLIRDKFNFEQTVDKYYEYVMQDKNLTEEQVRSVVGAIRYRYIMDKIIPDRIREQITNMELLRQLAIANNNSSAATVAEVYINQLKYNLLQIQHQKSYMPHTWSSPSFFMKGAELAGLSPDKAKKLLEKIDAKTSHLGGTGQVVDPFFLTREANILNYEKTPDAIQKYLEIFNRMLRFQHLYAMEELAEDLIKTEIPFMRKHAREMSAIVRGANKYGVKIDISELKEGDAVMFALKEEKANKYDVWWEGTRLISGVVKSANKNSVELEDGIIEKSINKDGKEIITARKTFNRFQIEALRKLFGVNWINRAKLLSKKVNLDKTTQPYIAQFLLRLEASAMLTGSAYTARNTIGGTLTSIELLGKEFWRAANKMLATDGSLKSQKGLTPEQIRKREDTWKFIEEHSVALLGNIDQVMGKLGGVANILKGVNEIDLQQINELIQFGSEWDNFKSTALDYNVDTGFRWKNNSFTGNKVTKFKEWFDKFALLANFNPTFLSKTPIANPYVNVQAGEKYLRFRVALMVVLSYDGLDIDNPIHKKMLVAFIDQALRHTQLLYRIGLDQGILESSAYARVALVNFLHYPISRLATGLIYISNMQRQVRRLGFKQGLIGAFIDVNENSQDKKELGKGNIRIDFTTGKGTKDEQVITYRDIRYARVVLRGFYLGLAAKLVRVGLKVFGPEIRYKTPAVGGMLYWLLSTASTGYMNYIIDGGFQIANVIAMLSFDGEGDDDKYLKRLRKALHLSQEEYVNLALDVKKDAKFIKTYQGDIDKMLENEYTMALIRDITENIPMGVGSQWLVQAISTALVYGLAPENFLELGMSLGETVFPGKLLRGPSYPLNIGYSPLHTKKIQYFDSLEDTKQDNTRISRPKVR